ncbi:pyruvate carboxylase subunit B [Selenomonas caprae]|jgi:oxaloacetate decarboxylase alpha subunit|uniref:Oxaloacetate decarboxylase, alpha subunit n=2 Tax=Selenomonas TaxID=970 RepID=A0A1I3GG64_SELRU|nr:MULTISPECIES: pyruvate carboxylase subunit B [Selenomonas]MBE6073770.1 pyruvate carboxylase subunit B [Selenomonas ruminantium]TYZ29446.1 pyruvate carboxylase subunit B [Selenomonas caprae]SFI22242.1 oxaloacetate decarboxylase, alpha subunit [Selenomonas ruminantium]
MAKKPVQIMETVLRDGHQSLCATRMRIEDMLPQLEALDAVGYKALEAWGGATFDTCLRFLGEDPWERLDTLKANLNTPIQMLLRGQNLLGYNHYSNDVVEKFVQKASQHGVGVFRIFDALNDVRNLKVAINAALNCPEKPEVQGCLVYTISPVHTNEKFVELAKELQDMGCHSVCIKDMSGLLKPYVAEDLVKKLKAALDIPVELHTHCTSGFGHATYLKAIEAGVDIIDTALAPFSSDTSQPCTETMVRALEGTEYDTGIDVQKLTPISKHFLSVKKRIINEFNLKGYFDINPNVLDFQIPGGMLSNLANQLKEAGMEDKYQDLLDEMPRVRKDLGYPPLVTPSSQIVGTMATFNVMSGERYKMVPKEFKDLARGKFGRTPVAIDRDFLTKTLGIAPEDIIEDCSIEDAKAKTFAEFEAELKEKGYLNPSEEDVLSYALFPQVAEEFFQNHYQKITAYKKA